MVKTLNVLFFVKSILLSANLSVVSGTGLALLKNML